jgi:uncharacterized protein
MYLDRLTRPMAHRDHFLSPLLGTTVESLVLGVRRLEHPVAVRLLTAFDSASRRRGLLGRLGLDAEEAIVIAPCNAVHTFGMRFPIDVIYARRDGHVVKIRESVPPRRVSAALSAFAVIEMAAGTVARTGVKVGDVLEVSDRTDRPASESAQGREAPT